MHKIHSGFTEFLKAALRDPRSVSTIFPSLKYLAQALVRHAEIGPESHVLELGSGSGAITRHILKNQKGLASFTGVEIDTDLVDFLRRTYPGQKFLDVSADKLSDPFPESSMDAVICSLPWTMLPTDTQEKIIQEVHRVLKPGGRLTTFICIHALPYPGAPRVKRNFQKQFAKFEKCESIARNIPPANVYRGIK